MKGQIIKKFINDEEGLINILFLIILPILIFVFLSAPTLGRYQRSTNTVLQNAIDYSVKDAAAMIDKESQAFGEPRIDYLRAKERFLDTLEYNINAYEEEGCAFEDIEYSLLIYNGDNKYEGYDGGKISSYAFFNNNEEYITDSINGFPIKLGITEDGITDDLGDTDIEISADRPFVLAVVRARIVPIVENEEDEDKESEYVTRWALGEIRVRKEGD